MARAKRNKSHRLAKLHDRRSHDLPRNAEVAEVEVDDPLALEPGEKIVVLRSIRNDPLGRLHSHRQIDEAQYLGGRAFQNDWEKAVRGPQAIDPAREYVDGAPTREPVTESQRQAVLRLNRAERELGADGSALVHDVLVQRHDHGAGWTTTRAAHPALERLFLAPVSRMPRPACPDVRVCDGEEKAHRARSRALTRVQVTS
jgi:hypothetical protein